MSDYINPVTFNIIWEDFTSVTENDNIQVSESDSASAAVQEISCAEFEQLYGFDPSILDKYFDCETTVENICAPNPVVENEATPDLENAKIENPSNIESEKTELSDHKEFENIDIETVRQRISEQINKSTIKKTKLDLKKIERFLALKGETKAIHETDIDLLDEYVANFVLSCKTKQGKDYEPSSIRNMLSSFDRELKRRKYPHTIMDSKGLVFSRTRDAFAAKSTSLKKKRERKQTKRSFPINRCQVGCLI